MVEGRSTLEAGGRSRQTCLPFVIGGAGAWKAAASERLLAYGSRENAGQDPCDHARRGLSAVSLQVELSLEGLVDRLDDLAERFEQVCAGSLTLALAQEKESALKHTHG